MTAHLPRAQLKLMSGGPLNSGSQTSVTQPVSRCFVSCGSASWLDSNELTWSNFGTWGNIYSIKENTFPSNSFFFFFF